jgi:tubulin-folding cofactor B
MCGTPSGRMKLQLRDKYGVILIDELEDDKVLGNYPIYDYVCLYIIDLNPQKEFVDISDITTVKKFELSDEEYNKREGLLFFLI